MKIKKTINITTEQEEFLQKHNLSISHLISDTIDHLRDLDGGNLKYTDVDSKVLKIMREMVEEAKRHADRKIDWRMFKDYSMEYFMLPECTIERCVKVIIDENK